MKTRLATLALALLSIFASTAAAHADTIVFTLTHPVQGAAPGGTIYYQATVSAPISNAAAVYLNGDSFTLAGPFALDDSPFANFPFFLNPGDTYTGLLFDVFVPLGSPLASFSGTFNLLGGPTGGDQTLIGASTFTAASTPEPSSLLLLSTGLVLVFAFAQRRHPTPLTAD